MATTGRNLPYSPEFDRIGGRHLTSRNHAALSLFASPRCFDLVITTVARKACEHLSLPKYWTAQDNFQIRKSVEGKMYFEGKPLSRSGLIPRIATSGLRGQDT